MKHLRFPLRVGLLAALLLTVSACETKPAPASVGGTVSAPDLKFMSLDGAEIRLSDMRGKVILLNFWATWCPPCRVELPHFEELYQAYKADDLVVVGVSMDAGAPELVRRFVKQFGLTYPVTIEPAQKMEAIWAPIEGIPTVDGFGEGPPVIANGSIALMPTTFIIDRTGKIYEKHVGPRTREQLEPKLRMLMGKEDQVAGT